ncbi:MAG: metal ABC transporter permease [Bacteroidetes bacterium]|nr:metal ABC transporter permease [Bacteroidota bacterium]MDA0873659.1 metal ABC transporter permease [Bacteroidota bacterium]
MSASTEIQLIAVVVALSCALPGVFLVLRRMAMLSDAISHAILPGIVIAFFLTRDLSSPLLIFGAAGAGVLTVALVEVIRRTGLLKEDAAIGIVFPALFSVGVLLIARYAGDVHLDVDAVLLGELAFAPFDRLTLGGVDLGPRSLLVMGGILAMNVLFLSVFFKELKLTTFDAALAASLGFAPAVLQYVFMTVVSVTIVGAFDAVGSILVVALMVAPPSAAYLLTDDLKRMVLLSGAGAVICALGGYWMARGLDVSIAGSMATVSGLWFLVVLVFAPGRGILFRARQRQRQRSGFARDMLLIHLYHHEGLPEAERECRVDHLQDHLGWQPGFAEMAVRSARKAGYLRVDGGLMTLSESGRAQARHALVHI